MSKRSNLVVIALPIVVVLIIGLSVWAFAYVPNFSDKISGDNADWGGFGNFFWGLGTMLLTALSVYFMYRINSSIEHNRQAKDKFEIQKEIIREYKSLRDKCLIRVNSNQFQVDAIYIAQLESFLRELRGYRNIFPFLTDNIKRNSLNILQDKLRILQDPNSLAEWKRSHTPEEIASYECVMYSHSEWLLGHMTKDWYETVNRAIENSL